MGNAAEPKLQHLIRSAMTTGAHLGLMDAHALLACLGMYDAADALLGNWDSIVLRVDARIEAEITIRQAKGKV